MMPPMIERQDTGMPRPSAPDDVVADVVAVDNDTDDALQARRLAAGTRVDLADELGFHGVATPNSAVRRAGEEADHEARDEEGAYGASHAASPFGTNMSSIGISNATAIAAIVSAAVLPSPRSMRRIVPVETSTSRASRSRLSFFKVRAASIACPLICTRST
jgi:hypothetical protein